LWGGRFEHLSGALKLQHKQVDHVLGQLDHYLKQRDEGFDESIRVGLRGYRTALAQLTLVRSQVAKGGERQEARVSSFHYYSRMVETLLFLVKGLVDQVEHHPMANQLDAIYTLLWIKERAGQERGRLNQFFSLGYLSATETVEVNHYIREQVAKLRELFNNGYIADHQLYQAKLSNPENYRLIEYRNVFLSRLKKGEKLEQLRALIGFGGLIHTFKNYVIRGAEKYQSRFYTLHAQVIQLLNEYRLLQGVTQPELEQLAAVEANVQQYHEKMKIVASYKERQGVIAEIDAKVKVDDAPALSALLHLSRQTGVDPDHWFERATQRIGWIKQVTDQLHSELMLSAQLHHKWVEQHRIQSRNVLLLMVVASLLLAFLLGQRLLSKIAQVVSVVNRIEREGDLSVRIESISRDEIGQVGNALNRLLGSQQRVVQDVIRVTDAVSGGGFDQRVEASYLGDLQQLKEGVNKSVDQVAFYTQAMLQQSSELDSIIRSMGEGLVVVDKSNRIQRINPRLIALSGREESALKDHPVESLFSGEMLFSDGDLSSLMPLLQGRLQKIHDRDHDEFQQLLEHAPIPLLVVDRGEVHAGEPLFIVSREFENQMGYSQGSLQGEALSMLVANQDYSRLQQGVWGASDERLSEGGNSYHWVKRNSEWVEAEVMLIQIYCGRRTHVLLLINSATTMDFSLLRLTPFGQLFEQEQEPQLELACADHSTIPVSVSGSILYKGESDTIQGAVLLLRDVRELLTAESIKRASKAKDEFLASMSHELRTPLASIIGNSEFLADQEQNEEKLELVHAIEIAGRSQLALVNDILDMSKIESGKFSIDDRPYDLATLLKEVEQMFAGRIRDAGLTLRVEQPFRPEFQLIGDGQRIGQILVNMLGNALKFTERGTITLTVWVEQQRLYFTVRDTGIGMDQSVLERLFQRFEQADGSISRRFGGSGLGLFISLRLAELMGGTIEVESEEGEGSSFQLNLPLQVSDYPLRQKVEQRTKERGILAEQFHGDVLVAEDAPELQLLEQRLLESMGINVVTVADGQQAVEQGLQQPFDLILMDMQMPVMNGIEATNALRLASCKSPIVALTANVMQKHRDAFAAAGGDGFLSKPIDRQALKEVLKRYLRHEKRETVT